MKLAHLTLPTTQVEATASFLERALGLGRLPPPGNSPVEVVWLDLGHGQSLHIFQVDGFSVSPFESEFGRHIALFVAKAQLPEIRGRLLAAGVAPYDAIRATTFERFFFREPVNGYVVEVIEE